MFLVGYARVSTHEQSVDLQLDALKQAGCRRIFEEARSGADRERPKLKEAIEFLQAGDTLVVWKLDRLARSLPHLIEVGLQLQKMGCGLRSLTEAIDTSTGTGRFFFHVLGAQAELNLDILRERTLAGLAAARARGRKGGRPKSLDPQKVSIAEALLRDGLLTVKEVAKQVGVSEATLYKYIPAPRSSTEVGRTGS